MATIPQNVNELRAYRNTRLYRSLTRTLRVYNRRLVTGLRAHGFDDFSPAFPALLSNLDMEGTTIGVLAARAGVTRQAAGQLLRDIEQCGYVELRDLPRDGRATLVRFTARGKRLFATVIDLVEQIEDEFAGLLQTGEFDCVRGGLATIANHVDPGGALGVGERRESAGEASGSESLGPPRARRGTGRRRAVRG